jgi:hypothetical protein
MTFYYEDIISKLEPKCPPESYLPIEREAFRWVFDSIDEPRNFLAQAEKNPKAIVDKPDEEKCEFYALSFFNTADNAKARFQFFSKLSKNAYKRLGTKIARGFLSKEDGLGGKIDQNGHFNFHHIRDHKFFTKFTIIDNL